MKLNLLFLTLRVIAKGCWDPQNKISALRIPLIRLWVSGWEAHGLFRDSTGP